MFESNVLYHFGTIENMTAIAAVYVNVLSKLNSIIFVIIHLNNIALKLVLFAYDFWNVFVNFSTNSQMIVYFYY